MAKLKIVVHDRQGFTPEMIEKHETARQLLEQAINTKMFRERLLALRLTSTQGLTNEQVYNKIMTGAETLDPDFDYEADIWVQAYYQNNRVVGYTYPTIKETYLNTKFFGQYDYAEVAENMLHEWLHKIGFDHVSAKELTSVPYAVGYLIGDIIEILMSGKTLEEVDGELAPPVSIPTKPKKVLVCYRSWRTLFFKRCYYKES